MVSSSDCKLYKQEYTFFRKPISANDPSWALGFPRQTPTKYITDQKHVVNFFYDFKLKVLLQPLMRCGFRVVNHIVGTFVEEEPQGSSSSKVSNMEALQGTKVQ